MARQRENAVLAFGIRGWVSIRIAHCFLVQSANTLSLFCYKQNLQNLLAVMPSGVMSGKDRFQKRNKALRILRKRGMRKRSQVILNTDGS